MEKETEMKRNLIALALAGLFATAAYAEPTLTGDDTYVWRGASEATAVQSNAVAKQESVQAQANAYGQNGIYSFNP
jgi:hypothetical protein